MNTNELLPLYNDDDTEDFVKGQSKSNYDTTVIKSELTKSFPISVKKEHIQALLKKLHTYELYKEHIYSLNSATLGIYKINFLPSDEDDIFNIFNISKKEFYSLIESIPPRFNRRDMIIINPEHKVSSNPFNIFTTYLLHKIMISGNSDSDKYNGCMAILKMLHYKFFTSLIYRRFPFRPDEGIMKAAIESLSMKFDLAKLGTWKKVIEQRSMDTISSKSIHIDTIKKFETDKKILYLITDTQSRIREKVNLVTSIFYDMKDKESKIGTYGMVENINGEKILRNFSGSLDSIISRLSGDVLSSSNFIDGTCIKLLTGLNKELKTTMFKNLLLRFVDLAIFQNKTNKQNDYSTYKNEKVIVGHKELITQLIQVAYKTCVNNKVNMKNRFEILKAVNNTFKSSQIVSEDVLLIKRSIACFVDNFPGTKRVNTIVTLRSNLISYIVLLSFRYI